MIVTEQYMTRADGVTLVRSYSDAGCRIERNGVRYDEAIDPPGEGRAYTETDEPAGGAEATAADYAAALARLGVTDDTGGVDKEN